MTGRKIYFELLSSSNRKYEVWLDVKGKVMKQWYALFVSISLEND